MRNGNLTSFVLNSSNLLSKRHFIFFFSHLYKISYKYNFFVIQHFSKQVFFLKGYTILNNYFHHLFGSKSSAFGNKIKLRDKPKYIFIYRVKDRYFFFYENDFKESLLSSLEQSNNS